MFGGLVFRNVNGGKQFYAIPHGNILLEFGVIIHKPGTVSVLAEAKAGKKQEKEKCKIFFHVKCV